MYQMKAGSPMNAKDRIGALIRLRMKHKKGGSGGAVQGVSSIPLRFGKPAMKKGR